jgi:hypothetical protein
MFFRMQVSSLGWGAVVGSLSLGLGCNTPSESEVSWLEQSPVARLMAVLERDGQPGLSRAEIERASSPTVVFADHDTSGDGVLDEAELRGLLGLVSPLGKPFGFVRNPIHNLPLEGMSDFQGTPLEGCERFKSFVEDAFFHLSLVGGELGELPVQLKTLVDAGQCNIHDTGGAAVLAGLADTWRRNTLKDIFRNMGVD